MQIVIPIGDVFLDLFQGVELSDPDAIRKALITYYTVDDIVPEVELREGLAIVIVDEEAVETYQRDFDEAAALAGKGRYEQAKAMFERLIEQHPTVSELHRMYAQVLFESGEGEAAVDPLIDALRWDPENVHALVLMGNVLYKVRREFDAAKRYYERAAELSPDDYLTLNNLGAVLMELDRHAEAERFFQQALDVNSEYPNTYIGLGLLNARRREHRRAFEYGVEVLLRTEDESTLQTPAFRLTMKAAAEYAKTEDLRPLIDRYLAEVEDAAGKPVRTEERHGLAVRAKIEIAENHGRDHHLLLYRPGDPTLSHLMMHELTHLELIAEARKEGANRLFVSSPKEEGKFLDDHARDIRRLVSSRLPEAQARTFLLHLFAGLNSQIFNAPVDLFIEGRLHSRFPELRPVQCLSIFTMLTEYAKQAADRSIRRMAPKRIYNANTIYNLTHAFQLRDLYGLHLVADFNPSPQLLREAERLYDEYLQVQEERLAGEEYSFIHDWAEDLGLTGYFKLTQETAGSDGGLDEALYAVETDPMNLEDPERHQAESRRVSMKGSFAGSMSVTMYLVDALKLFEGKGPDFVKQVAYEVAMLGNYGLDPSDAEQKYTLKSVPGKKFSALHVLAYMYASFKEIDPTLDTELDFGDEYETAKSLL